MNKAALLSSNAVAVVCRLTLTWLFKFEFNFWIRPGVKLS